jgi:hydroxymethylpyrimidine kinase/phosphomethylpyrimidine kinase/thiamine-phosphate diphosphorylase
MIPAFAWTIAGSDSCGGAGIQADLKTFQNLGVHGCSVITAITAQDLQHVSKTFYQASACVTAQIAALDKHMAPAAIKVGMLGCVEIITAVTQYLANYTGIVIVDPLLVATSGRNLYAGNLDEYLAALKHLFPFVDVLTPNIHEAEVLVSSTLRTHADIERAASQILTFGVKSVVIKGGHFNDQFSHDYWTDGRDAFWLANQRIAHPGCHGSGCVFSSAITAAAALGLSLKDALVVAKMYVNRGMRLAAAQSSSGFFVHGDSWPVCDMDLPYLAAQPLTNMPVKFADDNFDLHGLYPIINSIVWLRRLLPLGIKYFQLRIKNKTGADLEDEIRQSINLAKLHNVRLYINDYWQLAIRHGAYGVHLGQEDLHLADVAAIYAAGLRLGISTHCYYEVARAHYYRPSYIACGPIFPTTSKVMSFGPQGLSSLRRWRTTLSYPLVAIGGIHAGNIHAVQAENVDAIAVISAITSAKYPEAAAQQLMAMVNHDA